MKSFISRSTPGQGPAKVSVSMSAFACASSMAQNPGSLRMRAMMRNAISALTFIS